MTTLVTQTFPTQGGTVPATNFTPSTERVRDRFIAHCEITQSALGGRDEYGAAFDRWLASVENEAAIGAPRTVTTDAEYEALPIGSVVRGNRYGQVAERVDENDEDNEEYRWLVVGRLSGHFTHAAVALHLGEATVLHLATESQLEKQILDLGNQLLREFRLDKHDWTIKMVDEHGFNAGRCWDEARTITLSRDFLLDTDVRNIRETILHEIAHALVSGKHDQEWFDKLLAIGGTGEWYNNEGTTDSVRITD